MAIDLNLAQQKFAANTPASAQIWASRTSQAAAKWERNAKSPESEANYAAGVQRAAAEQSRLRGLQGVSAAEFSTGVQAASNIFAQKTAAASQKWQAKFAPFAGIIDSVVAGLPARISGDGRANTLNRVVPIVEALQQAKRSGVGVSTFQAPTTGGFQPFGTPRRF